MLNLRETPGYDNRHVCGMPKTKCVIKIIHIDTDGESRLLCEWQPWDESQRTTDLIPSKGYLGTAKVIYGDHVGIGFHAWDFNNSEFVYYKIIQT